MSVPLAGGVDEPLFCVLLMPPSRHLCAVASSRLGKVVITRSLGTS
jgi:hypothetical protein